jgi:hypothetical protein
MGDQQGSPGVTNACEAQALEAAEERRVCVTPLAASFVDELAHAPEGRPIDALMIAYDVVMQDMLQPSNWPSDAFTQIEPALQFVGDARPCLVLLRRARVAVGSQLSLIIAHSLLGDYQGYGRLWNQSLQQRDVHALRHRGVANAQAFAVDHEGAVSMASGYATAIEATFTKASTDLIGASFGAVLVSHVAQAAAAAGGCPGRLILIDPPPAVPRELPVPRMLTSHGSGFRTAAMGVLLLYSRIEMGTSVWEQFPQLQSLPVNALSCFVAAQSIFECSSREEMAAHVAQAHQQMIVYRQCRQVAACDCM